MTAPYWPKNDIQLSTAVNAGALTAYRKYRVFHEHYDGNLNYIAHYMILKYLLFSTLVISERTL